jgi:putative transposase
MKTNIEPLNPETYYHIYNKGINGENIFKETRNYRYFLEKYAQYISPIADTYAYCLLKNHFHFLIRTHSETEIKINLSSQMSITPDLQKPFPWIISNSFASLFKCYAQSINKTYQRTGRLFEEPFRRIAVNSDAYISEIITYIHINPQSHGFVTDFRDYPHSSYQSLISNLPTKLKRQEVMKWFGGVKDFKDFHFMKVFSNLDKFEIKSE